jgi:hypothetical protein
MAAGRGTIADVDADIAVIGAGPGGLVAARWLKGQGFAPTIFERAATLGGQWTGDLGRSGVWPSMHTNTSRILTAFSDLEHETTAVFPSNRDVLGYLRRYAEKFGLTSCIRFSTPVRSLRRSGDRWVVCCDGDEYAYDRVVVASGRFQFPAVPTVDGLPGFAGSLGAIPSFDFRDPAPYRGKRILVAGSAISALEVASELALNGAARVVVTQRRQRYVLPKFAAGVPSDHRIFTRFGALAHDALPAAEVGRQLKEIVVEAGGSPEQYGAPAPDDSLLVAGVTLGQQYLPLVAEGRIEVRPWLRAVAGTSVTFDDGRTEEFDGVVFGTGFEQAMPFLSPEIQAALGLDAVHLDADRHTFHPDVPGVAFVGMWDQSGGYFVPLELQARWIAYAWAGVVAPPSESAQRRAIDVCRHRRGRSQKTRMNLVALTFAYAAGVEPVLANWPDLRRALLFGPLAPSSFRLDGPDALPEAAAAFARDAAAFGAITSNDFTDREKAYLAMVDDHHARQ